MTENKQDSMISIENVKKRYPKAEGFALNGMNLQIKAGEFFGLLGPNGCGKTTLISILCGLLRATEGNIQINGHTVPRYLKKVKPLMGLVPQDIALYPTLTIRENLKFFGHLYGIKGKLLKQRIDKYLEVGRLTQCADNLVSTYSGGMKRRANLAAGLLHEPKIMFLDEPTVNVDPQSRNVIFEILQELNQAGTTIIYTTHYLEEAQHLCSRVAIVDQGAVVTEGTPNELIKSTNSKDLGEVFMNLTGKHLRD